MQVRLTNSVKDGVAFCKDAECANIVVIISDKLITIKSESCDNELYEIRLKWDKQQVQEKTALQSVKVPSVQIKQAFSVNG